MLNRNYGQNLGSRSLALAATLNTAAPRLNTAVDAPAKCAGSKRAIRSSHIGEIGNARMGSGMPAPSMRRPTWAVSPRERVAAVAEAPPSVRWPVAPVDAPRRARGYPGQVQPRPDHVDCYRFDRARQTADRSTRRPEPRPCASGG